MKKVLAILAALASTLTGRPSETEVVAAVLWSEARGEGAAGIRAVAEVVRNRAQRSASTPYQVVTKPKQFSCLNGRQPARIIKRAYRSSGPDAKAWDLCLFIAEQLASGKFTDDRLQGATHYDSVRRPEWALQYRGKIGNHYFYR